MHVNQVILYEENIGPQWETSRQCCVMRKVICKEVTAGRRFNFLLDSVLLVAAVQLLSTFQAPLNAEMPKHLTS